MSFSGISRICKKNWGLILGLGFVIFTAIYLQISILSARPVHCDEAVQMYRVGEMLSGEIHCYNPNDFHGPSLYFFAYWLYNLLGIKDFAGTNLLIFRSVPAIFGFLSCLLIPLAFFGRRLIPCTIAGTVLSLSSLYALYSGYFIQEILLVSSAWASAGLVFFQRHTLANALAVGVLLGICISSKETWILLAGAFVLAYFLASLLRKKRSRDFSFKESLKRLHFPREQWSYYSFVLGIAGTLCLGFYSSFGKNPSGILDFFRAFPIYFSRASIPTSIEGSPLGFNGIFPLLSDSLLITTFFLVFSILCKFSSLQFPKFSKLGIFSLTSSLFLFLIYALLPYKMPWLFINLIPGIALFAGSLFTKNLNDKSLPQYAPKLLGAALIFISGAILSRPKDIAALQYAPTGTRVPEIPTYIAQLKNKFLQSQNSQKNNFFIAIISENYWPLPWYLRNEKVGYFPNLENTPKEILENAPLVISDFELEPHNFVPVFDFELRPGIILSLREHSCAD